MVWCANCAKNIARPDFVEGKTCCSYCGRVLDEDNFSQEPTFVKNAGGQSQLAGNYVRTIQREISASRERTMDEARYGINSLIYALDIDGGDSIARPAEAFYGIALERNFTKGRRKEQVQAACLYISCRQNKKPYLLIDFSEHLRINVYVLGAVFLQLCKLLSLEEHPIVQKPVDPSLFIHRFTYRMFGSRNPAVSRTALQIVASMKRDWMQTGRKPGGLCGAALYISALSHGLKCTKSEIIRVVHICEATLTKRLVEFENTESGGLTIEEFNQKAEELENEERLTSSLNTGVKASGIIELLCRHKDSGEPPFAHGLCKSCFEDFVKISGGLDGGSEPPAFQRAERERFLAEEAAAQSSKNLDSLTLPGPVENTNELLNSDEQRSTKNMSDCEVSQPAEAGSTGANDSGNDQMHTSDATVEDTWSFSDIEDAEVDSYLNNEEEHRHKKKIWEKMNAEYIKEQEAKEKNSVVEDEETAQKRAAARKERQLKRAAEKNSGPPETAAEATMQALGKKRLSSKIRSDVLKELLKEAEEGFESNKKIRTGAEEEAYNGKMEPELEDTRDDFGDNVEEFDYDIYGDYNQFDDF